MAQHEKSGAQTSETASEVPQLGQVVKQYEIVRESMMTYRRLAIQHNGTPFLWTHMKTNFISAPTMTLHTEHQDGPVVAGVKFTRLTMGVDVAIGDPQSMNDSQFLRVDQNGMTGRSYTFPAIGTGHIFEWRRTHNKEFGSTRLSNSDFKLVDPSNNDQVLAVYIKDSFFGGSSVAHIDFFTRLDDNLELQAIAGILGIEEKLRMRRSSSGAASGASASASASAGVF